MPDGSDDYASDYERLVETKKLWRRFCQENCKPPGLDHHSCTVGYGVQASHAAVRKAHAPEEKRRRTVARKQSSAKGQKEVFNARVDAIFEEAALPPANEFDGDKPCNRQFTIMSNTDACNYQAWRLEEDSEVKAELRNLLPLSLIEVL